VSARILVAEDEPDIRQLIVVSLRRAGHTVEQAEDGDAAVAQAQADPPDLIIVDVMMPGLNGHEVAQCLTGDPRTAQVPILMLSAKGQARDVDEGLASGARAYVVKPFSPRELVARVKEMLEPGC
jgi:two-component system phosphate regulon response regulator PhoB